MPNAGDFTPRGVAMIREAIKRAFDMKVAADANDALVRDAPFQLEHRAEGQERQRFEMWLLLGESLRRAVLPQLIGDRV